MENKSINFENTRKLYLNLRRETLPGDNKVCSRCDKENIKFYWKVGFVDVDKRASEICDECHIELGL